MRYPSLSRTTTSTLFDRISNKLRLTESGEQLRQYAEHIVYLYDEMEVIVPAILQNELDVAVVEGEVDNPYIQSVRIGVDPIMFNCSPEHQGERHPSPEQAPHQERATSSTCGKTATAASI